MDAERLESLVTKGTFVEISRRNGASVVGQVVKVSENILLLRLPGPGKRVGAFVASHITAIVQLAEQPVGF